MALSPKNANDFISFVAGLQVIGVKLAIILENQRVLAVFSIPVRKVPVFLEGPPHWNFITCYQSEEYRIESRKVPAKNEDHPQRLDLLCSQGFGRECGVHSAHILRITIII